MVAIPMNKAKRAFWRLFVSLMFLSFVAIFALKFYARPSIESAIRKLTGFPLEIGSAELGLVKSQVDVRDVKLTNPREFEEKICASIPQLQIKYAFGTMLSNSPHITNLALEIDEFMVVINKKGQANVLKLKGVMSPNSGSGKYKVDSLHVKIQTLTVKDYREKTLSERKLSANIDVIYKNITEPTDINRLVILSILNKFDIPEIELRLEDVIKNLGNVTDDSGKLINAQH